MSERSLPRPAEARDRLLRGSPILPVARGVDWEDLRTSAAGLVTAGFPVIEVTFDAPTAADHIVRLLAEFGDDLLVGAGTVRSVDAVRSAVDSGAAFLVSPSLDTEVVEAAVTAGLPMIPGVLTPTEADHAMRAGASAVKIFPAGPLGTGYLGALLGPMPELPVIVTGGIDVDDAASWLDTGATAVGLGGALFGGPAAGLAATLDRLTTQLDRWMR